MMIFVFQGCIFRFHVNLLMVLVYLPAWIFDFEGTAKVDMPYPMGIFTVDFFCGMLIFPWESKSRKIGSSERFGCVTFFHVFFLRFIGAMFGFSSPKMVTLPSIVCWQLESPKVCCAAITQQIASSCSKLGIFISIYIFFYLICNFTCTRCLYQVAGTLT